MKANTMDSDQTAPGAVGSILFEIQATGLKCRRQSSRIAELPVPRQHIILLIFDLDPYCLQNRTYN